MFWDPEKEHPTKGTRRDPACFEVISAMRRSFYAIYVVLVFLKVFSRRRATIESVAPVSSTARKTSSPIFTRIQKTKSSSSEPPPYSPSGNFTSTPAAMSDLAIQANRRFLELDSSGGALFPGGRFLGSAEG